MLKYISILLILSIGFSQNKVNINNLVKYGDKWFKPNYDRPFSGIAFDIDKNTGEKILECGFTYGVLNGKYFRWYAEGKQKHSEGIFKDDEKDGLWTEWYENGQKHSEYTWVSGKKNGPNKSWTFDGRETKDIILLGDSIISGKVIDYHNNGKRKSEWNYLDGKKDGLWTWWFENGQEQSQRIYDLGNDMGANCNDTLKEYTLPPIMQLYRLGDTNNMELIITICGKNGISKIVPLSGIYPKIYKDDERILVNKMVIKYSFEMDEPLFGDTTQIKIKVIDKYKAETFLDNKFEYYD